jgi:foldase protein PrsA
MFNNKIKGQLLQTFAEDLASQEYLSQKVNNQPLYRKKAEQALKQLAKEKSIDELIKGKGFTKEQFLQFLTRDQQVNAYYQQRFEHMTYDYVKVKHILLSFTQDAKASKDKAKGKRTEEQAKQLALQLRARLVKGESFDRLAKQYSEDPGSKNKGGVVEGPLMLFAPEFAKAAKELPLGEISQPVKTSFGYHILQVLERRQLSMAKAPEKVKQMKKEELRQQVIKQELGFKSLLPKPEPVKK